MSLDLADECDSPVYDDDAAEQESFAPAPTAPDSLAHTAPEPEMTRAPATTAVWPSADASKPPAAAAPVTPRATAWPIGYNKRDGGLSSSQASSSSGKKGSGNKRKGAGSVASQPNLRLNGGLDLGSASQGSRYVECPACQRSMPYFELDSHLEQCGREDVSSATKKRKSAADSSMPALPASGEKSKPAAATVRKIAAADELILTQTNGSSLGQCPACGESVVVANINHHLDVECGRRQQKAAPRITAHVVPAPDYPAVAPPAPAAVPVAAAPAAVAPLSVPVPLASDVAAVPPLAAAVQSAAPLASATAVSALDGAVLLITATDPVTLIGAETDILGVCTQDDSPEMEDSAAAATQGTQANPSAAAPAATPHAFFTAGARSAAAFRPLRKHKNDSVRCSSIVFFTASRCASTPSSLANGHSFCGTSALSSAPAGEALVALEWQDCPNPSTATHAPACGIPDLAFSNTSIKCHEPPPIDLWTEVHIHASKSVLHDSPVVDFTSPNLACNASKQRRFQLSPSMLKSLLQKNVRLSRPAAAVRCALQLMNHSFIEFLRRFSIIIFEDAILHPAYPFIVWLLMACSRKDALCSAPTRAHVDLLLRVVHEVASVNVKDALLSAEGANADDSHENSDDGDESSQDEGTEAAAAVPRSAANSSLPPPTLASPMPELTPEQRILVKCILLRACQGGSAWDLQMLRSYAALWHRRFRAENLHRARQQTALNASGGVTSQQQPLPPSPASAGFIAPASGGNSGNSWLSFLSALYSPSRNVVPAGMRLPCPIDVTSVGYLTNEDLVLSAVDQHCSPIVERLLSPGTRTRAEVEKRCSQTHSPSVMCMGCDELLKGVLWRCRGSVTNKNPLRTNSEERSPDKQTAALFHAIKGDIDAAAKSILAARMQRF